MKRTPVRPHGFTLLELMLALFILAILAAGLSMPLAAQVSLRRVEESKRQLDDARDALLGFAAANGRLPCPATGESRGTERFAPGSDARDGLCADFFDGLLPAATLGLSPLDAEGFARDAWGSSANRIRYAVFGGRPVGGIANPLTRVNGVRQATLDEIGAAPGYLVICSTGATAEASGCGPAANQLTRKAAFVLMSLGPNAPETPPRGSDESRNVDGDGVFVAHEPARDFDDIVIWAGVNQLASRLVAAGRAP